LKIAIIGTDGIPARYGGFETFVEQVVPHFLVGQNEVTVVGSSVGRAGALPRRDGLSIINLPLKANGATSVAYDLLSFLRVFRWADAVILLGVSAGAFVPVMRLVTRGGKLLVNVDGLESRRQKWRGMARLFLMASERVAVRHAPIVVADNKGMADILGRDYGRTATVIAYGGDHVRQISAEESSSLLGSCFRVAPDEYALTVARIEPENNIVEMLRAFRQSALSTYVLVGNFATTDYGRAVRREFQSDPRVCLVESLYDPRKLAALRSRCKVYLHGHSVGGTNPSLVEMLPYARPILSYDCVFNRSTLGGAGGYFQSEQDLVQLLCSRDLLQFVPPKEVRESDAYRWGSIAKSYVELLRSAAK
jgi:glycosyltransferase involved in cell wall biosynthesis